TVPAGFHQEGRFLAPAAHVYAAAPGAGPAIDLPGADRQGRRYGQLRGSVQLIVRARPPFHEPIHAFIGDFAETQSPVETLRGIVFLDRAADALAGLRRLGTDGPHHRGADAAPAPFRQQRDIDDQ